MRKIEPEFITGMGYIGASPGVLYRMGGAGEQTVVTGNPALLEGVKGNRFTALTLHGKSTQGSTTGAQLCDFRNRRIISGGGNIIITFNKDGIGIAKGTPGNEAYAFTIFGDPVDLSLLEIGETYTSNESIRYVNKDNLGRYFYSRSIMFTEDIARIEVYIQRSVKEYKDGEILSPMFNKGNTVLAFEPYTGGKPSPSPEYPQEIESAGDAGEIGVEVLGKNLIPFPYPALGGAGTQIERGGVKYTVQSDGGIRCVGTPTSVFGVTLSRIKFSDIQLSVQNPTDGKIVLSGGNLFFDFNNNSLFIYFAQNQVGKPIDKVIYPQIELGTVATSYEPYKPAQTLIIPTPNGLPGIPVSSDGNYTDEKGQQWVCDEVDFKKGVYVQRVAKEIPQTRFTVRETVDNEGRYQFMYAFKNIYKNGGNECLISHGIYWDWGTKKNTWAINTTSFYYLPAERTTVDKIKEKILSLINSDNPLTFLGQLETPIEIPLTTEQLAKYKSLRTYSPTTTVINDADAWMSAGYKRRK